MVQANLTHVLVKSLLEYYYYYYYYRTVLLLNWDRATPDRPFVSCSSSSQTRPIGHTP